MLHDSTVVTGVRTGKSSEFGGQVYNINWGATIWPCPMDIAEPPRCKVREREVQTYTEQPQLGMMWVLCAQGWSVGGSAFVGSWPAG